METDAKDVERKSKWSMSLAATINEKLNTHGLQNRLRIDSLGKPCVPRQSIDGST